MNRNLSEQFTAMTCIQRLYQVARQTRKRQPKRSR